MANNKWIKACPVFLFLIFLGVPSAYGGLRKGSRGTRIKGAEVRRLIFRTSHSSQKGRAPVSAKGNASSGLASTGSTQLPGTRSTLVLEPISSLPTNSLSRSMQQKIALEMRPFLHSFENWRLPEQAASFEDEYFGVMTLGNLTELSPAQYEQALKEYKVAMKALENLSKYVNTTIYYMGTSETTGVVEPFQIERMNKEIMQVGELIDKARVSWGNDPVLMRATSYLNNLTQFYRMLGTGMYEKIGEQEKIIARTDGHVYNAKEFGLTSEIVEAKIPQWHLMDPATWFTDGARGALPRGLRVAILQDDKDVINAIHKMQKRAGLKDWEIDFYDDPEKFLNQGAYKEYDLILTDVLIQNGGGRYLARQLRHRGYEGSILTLSGFEPGLQDFFNDGFDGMIVVSCTNDIAGRIWTRLNNYFILKEKYGWKH